MAYGGTGRHGVGHIVSIRDLRLYRFSFPLVPPLRLKTGRLSRRHGCFVRLVDHEGRVGSGEVAPLPGFSGDNLRDIIVAWPHWRDRLLTDRIAVRRIAHDGLPPGGFPPSLAFGLGCAWRDARGEFSGPTSQPVNILLSGRRGSLVDEARHWRTLGFFHFKLKVAKGDSEEVAIVESLAGEVGPERLRLDANRRWSFDVAKSFFLAIRDCEPDYVEEPLRSPAELDSLYEATGLPLAYDETLDDLKPAMLRRARGVKALVLKPSLVGGLVRNETWVRYARAMGAQAVVSSGFNSSLGLYHLCHLARNWDASGIPAGLATVHFNRNEPILDPGRLEDGCLFFREAPRVDWAKCEPVD
uniref:o-succinylbenzoate synthase n=1 Tax=Candidatus Kentrum sp. TC TaxID=2126339 RepID=A0A450YTC7_9GAMM|nr:MAG: O-succinylbenzoate synthase [Candidatus Kentron sp. TC]